MLFVEESLGRADRRLRVRSWLQAGKSPALALERCRSKGAKRTSARREKFPKSGRDYQRSRWSLAACARNTEGSASFAGWSCISDYRKRSEDGIQSRATQTRT